MTNEKKQELRQLLTEAMENLEIRPRSVNESRSIPVDVYRKHLQERWTSYSSKDLSVVMSYEPHIVNEVGKLKLLDYLREKLASFIHEDRILSASHFLLGGFSDGFPLDDLLGQLLKITIAYGIEDAVSTFDKCTKETKGSFQYIALLEGIKLGAKIQVLDGIQLVPLSTSTSELPHYLHNRPLSVPENFFSGKTLLVVNYSVSPIFHKPFQTSTIQEYENQENHIFRIELNSKDLSNFKGTDLFLTSFSQSLSLACNSEVKISFITRFLAEDKLYNLSGMMGGSSWKTGPFGNITEVGQTQIDKAKSLYKTLVKLNRVNLNPKDKKKLQIAINRWIKSTTNKNPEDGIIDLVIALEALYLPDTTTESTYKLSVRASWHLGKNKEDRKKLLAEFKQLYRCRSAVVHGGKFRRKPLRLKVRPFLYPIILHNLRIDVGNQ